MKVKRVPGVYGFCAAWDGMTRSLMLACFLWCWRFHWPRIGACKRCGHGPLSHVARRDHGMIQWRCNNPNCDCDYYDPESK